MVCAAGAAAMLRECRDCCWYDAAATVMVLLLLLSYAAGAAATVMLPLVLLPRLLQSCDGVEEAGMLEVFGGHWWDADGSVVDQSWWGIGADFGLKPSYLSNGWTRLVCHDA